MQGMRGRFIGRDDVDFYVVIVKEVGLFIGGFGDYFCSLFVGVKFVYVVLKIILVR